MQGIDVSVYNGRIDWKQVRQAGVKFVIIRAGLGGIQDEMFREHIQGAAAEGLHIGAYWVCYAGTPSDAVREAERCLETVWKYHGDIDIGIAYDYEEATDQYLRGRGQNPTRQSRTAVVHTFMETIRKNRFAPLLYAPVSYLRDYLDTRNIPNSEIWLAQWGVPESARYRDSAIWQYSSEGRIQGISTVVDLNRGYFTLPEKNPEPQPENPAPAFSVGDRVRLKADATVYGTSIRFDGWVYQSTLYILEISGHRAVVSVYRNGPVTGAVDTDGLIKV